MKMNRTLIAVALCAAALSIPACDDADTVERIDVDGLVLASPEGIAPASDAVDFREPGPAMAVYVTSWGPKPIQRGQVKAIVDACSVQQMPDPMQTCTLSWYQPDINKSERVLGLGCSMVATFDLFKCYYTAFVANDAKPL